MITNKEIIKIWLSLIGHALTIEFVSHFGVYDAYMVFVFAAAITIKIKRYPKWFYEKNPQLIGGEEYEAEIITFH